MVRPNWSCGSDHLGHRSTKDNMNVGATTKMVASDSGHVEVKNVNYRRKDCANKRT